MTEHGTRTERHVLLAPRERERLLGLLEHELGVRVQEDEGSLDLAPVEEG